MLGDMAIIAVASVFGAFVAASRLSQPSRVTTMLFIFRAVAIATFSTGAAAKALASTWFETKTGVSIEHSFYGLAFLAFWIAAIGDGWFAIKDAVMSRLERFFHAGSR